MASLRDAYIGETLQPLTADLARDALHAMPEAPTGFIVQWLRQRVPNHEGPMSLRRRNEALKQEMSALQGDLASKITKEKPAGLADCTEDCDMDMPFAFQGLPQMQTPFKRGQLLQYQPRTDTWEKVLVLLGPGILETFSDASGERLARLMLGATGSAKIEHEKLPPEFEGYAIEVSNLVQAEPALTHLCLAAPTEEARREWLLAINGHTTMLLCKMGATIATLYAELQRLKSGAGLAPAKPEGEEMAQLVRRLSRLEQQVQPEEAQEPRKPKRADDEVDPAMMPKDYDSALEESGGETRLREYKAFSQELKETYKPSKDLVGMMGKDRQTRRSLSTKMNYQPYKNTLKELYAFCKDKAPMFFAKVRAVAERTGGENVEPPLKSMERCRDKAQFKYKDKNGEVSWHRLTDIVRDTIVYKNLDDMYKGLRAIHEDEEIDIIECNDRYMNPLDGGYRDLQLNLRIEGMVCELQLNTKWMLHVKENAGHRAFEVSREVMAAAAEPDAVERCRNILQWGKENLGANADAELQEMLNDDKKGLLHQAAKAGNAQLVSIFLAFRADVNHRDQMMRTPLHVAMSQGHERAMWALLCARADIDNEEDVDPATMPTKYDSALELSGGAMRLHNYKAFSGELKEKYEPNKDLVDMMEKDWQKRRSFSTKMNYQPYKNTLEELYTFCKEKAPMFFAKVRAVAERTGGRNVEPPLKGMPRSRDKAQFKYKDKNGDISWHRLTDIVRDTIVYKNLDDMYKGLRAIHEDEEIDIIECNDRYMNPLDGGYRDLQLSLRIEGMVCELQLNTKWMLHVKENAGHRAFEVSREVMAAVAEPNAVERCHNILQWGKENLGPNADAELQEMLNDDKKGLLHKAAKAGNAHLVSIFLAFRADVNHRDPKMMRTPLHEAMAQGHERAMWALLCARADLQALDQDGQVPLLDGLLKLRQSGGDEGVARLVSVAVQYADGGLDQLREARDDLGAAVKRRLVPSQELIASCADGNLAKVKQLLTEWADPNTTSSAKDGHPPLHAVLLRPQGLQPVHFEILKALLDMDADLGVTTAMPAGETPRTFTLLHCALHSKSSKALKILVAAGLRHEGKPLSQVLDPDELRSEEPSVWSMLAPMGERRVHLLDESLVSVGEMLELGATPSQVKALCKNTTLETPDEFLQQVVLKGLGAKELAKKLQDDPHFLAPTLPMPPFDAVREALQQAPADLRNDRDVVLACISHDAACLADAPEALRSDRSFLLDAVQRHPRALEFVGGFREDPDFVEDSIRLHTAVLMTSAGGPQELSLKALCALDLLDAQLKNDSAVAFQATQALARWGTWRDVDFSQMAELRSVPHDSEVLCACTTGAGRLAVGCTDGTILLHDLESDEPTAKLAGHEKAVYSLCLMSVEILASGSGDKTVRTWNLRTKEALQVLSGHTNLVLGLARLSDTQLASASDDKTVRLWSLAKPEECRVLQGHTSEVLCLCITTTGSLVSGSGDKTLRAWNPETGEELHELRGHANLCQASPELLASGGSDQTVRLWSLSTWAAVRVLEGLTGWVFSLCLLAPNHLAAADSRGRLRVWSVQSGEPLHDIQKAHTREIPALVMMKVRGEPVLCSGSTDSTLKLWQLQARP